MRSIRFTKKILTFTSLGVLAAASVLLGVFMNSRTSDASVAGWDAGYIISDSVFTNKNTMSAGGIQAFLNSKVPSCDTWGTQPSEFGGGTRRQWAEARGYSPPYTCLKDYHQGGKSAAQIIYDTAQTYGINPQVLLVLLQKEQSLVTDTWPLSIQYRSATGYGCPDNAACDADYYGFTNQVKWAATMFRAILNDSPTWYTPYELGWNYIQYNPIASCGGSNVNIRNRSTQALYNYTPYQPNSGALNAGWGTAHCGSYGNRNFYLYFTNWFGSTRTSFVSLETPRWMQTVSDVRKKDPSTGDDIDGILPQGMQLQFKDKIYVNGNWYLRTAYDKAHGFYKGVLLTDLQEIPYEPFETPRFMELNADVRKVYPHAGTSDRRYVFRENEQIEFDSKINVNGRWYYRTSYDTQHNTRRAFPASRVRDIEYTSFETPRFMQIANATQKLNPVTGEVSGGTIAEGAHIRFTSKIWVNNKRYYRTATDTTNSTALAIPAKDVENIPFESYAAMPHWLELKNDSRKVNPITGQTTNDTFGAGRHVLISQKVNVNGTWYYRSQYDVEHHHYYVMPATDFQEIPYEPLDDPRGMKVRFDTRKQNPKTGQHIDETFRAGRVIDFDTKIKINGRWYLRSTYDTTNGYEKGILLSHLEEL